MASEHGTTDLCTSARKPKYGGPFLCDGPSSRSQRHCRQIGKAVESGESSTVETYSPRLAAPWTGPYSSHAAGLELGSWNVPFQKCCALCEWAEERGLCPGNHVIRGSSEISAMLGLMRFDAHWLAARGEGPSSTCRPRPGGPAPYPPLVAGEPHGGRTRRLPLGFVRPSLVHSAPVSGRDATVYGAHISPRVFATHHGACMSHAYVAVNLWIVAMYVARLMRSRRASAPLIALTQPVPPKRARPRDSAARRIARRPSLTSSGLRVLRFPSPPLFFYIIRVSCVSYT